jgi:adenylate cyclase
MERRVTAILIADVVGFSRLMGKDEEGTLTAIKRLWNKYFGSRVSEYHGRVVKLMGDGALVVFSNVVDAVGCAITGQRDAIERNARMPADKRI